jgi:hypothetical protein
MNLLLRRGNQDEALPKQPPVGLPSRAAGAGQVNLKTSIDAVRNWQARDSVALFS